MSKETRDLTQFLSSSFYLIIITGSSGSSSGSSSYSGSNGGMDPDQLKVQCEPVATFKHRQQRLGISFEQHIFGEKFERRSKSTAQMSLFVPVWMALHTPVDCASDWRPHVR